MNSRRDSADADRSLVPAVCKVLTVVVTIALLTSFAAVAAFAALLVPAHVWAARRSGLLGRLGWGLLAGASVAMAWAVVTGGSSTVRSRLVTTSLPSTTDVTVPSPVDIAAAEARLRPECDGSEGATGAIFELAPDATGAPTVQAALSRLFETTVPDRFPAPPDDARLRSAPVDEVGFAMPVSRDDGAGHVIEHGITYRSEERREASISVVRAPRGGWHVSGFSICNSFYSGDS